MSEVESRSSSESEGVPQPPGRVRLFVALELPEEVRDLLIDWRHRLGPAFDALRAINREFLHATLCFIGSRPADDVPSIATACAVAGPIAEPPLRLGDAVWLPARRPRVLAVALDDVQGTLARIQAALSDALSAGGWYSPERRPYFAHVTVARTPRGVRAPRTELPPLQNATFHATDVTLYRSHLRSRGASYEPLAKVALGSPRG